MLNGSVANETRASCLATPSGHYVFIHIAQWVSMPSGYYVWVYCARTQQMGQLLPLGTFPLCVIGYHVSV